VDAVTLQFGRPQPIHEHGILLPCVAGENGFIELRKHVLGTRSPSRLSPHITLAHPRNPKAAGNCLARARLLPEELSIMFTCIHLIEQTGTAPWRVLDTFTMMNQKGGGGS
jgi:hypothetical protein